MTIKYLDQIEITGKRVILRVDYNVPYDREMRITDDTRIRATIPTIKYCLEKSARVILVSHMGRPKGQVKPSLSLLPVAKRLEEILSMPVLFNNAYLGDETVTASIGLKPGEILLLENIRFYPGEEKNDQALGRLIARHGEVFINDAFAAAHRGHASNFAVCEFMETVAAGFLLKNEIEFSQKTIESAKRPFGAIIGGAKVSSKLDVLTNIITKVDFLIIGGGMAFTFLKACGHPIGKSLLEEELIDSAIAIMKKAKENDVDILLPVDIVGAEEFDNDSPSAVYAAEKIPDNIIGLDIGPASVRLFTEKIITAKTIIWNGPMGAFEMPKFADGTNRIAKALAESDCFSVVGGGDSVTAINQAGVSERIGYISTGGGAFLELLEGKILPGIAALDK